MLVIVGSHITKTDGFVEIVSSWYSWKICLFYHYQFIIICMRHVERMGEGWAAKKECIWDTLRIVFQWVVWDVAGRMKSPKPGAKCVRIIRIGTRPEKLAYFDIEDQDPRSVTKPMKYVVYYTSHLGDNLLLWLYTETLQVFFDIQILLRSFSSPSKHPFTLIN